MAETVKDDQGRPRNEAMRTPGLERILDMQRPAMQAMADVNGKLYEGIAAVNKEWASFINRRLLEDMTIPERLAGCTSLQDLMRVYTNYVQDAYTHFQKEFEQLTKLNQSIAQETMTTLRTHMERAAQNKP